MPPTVSLTCPVDGLPLTSRITATKGDDEQDGVLGGHLHLDADNLTCPSEHSWRVTMELERTA